MESDYGLDVGDFNLGDFAQHLLAPEQSGLQLPRVALQTVTTERAAHFLHADNVQVSGAGSFPPVSMYEDEMHNLLPVSNVSQLLASQLPRTDRVSEGTNEYLRMCIVELIGICCAEAPLGEKTIQGRRVPSLGTEQLGAVLDELGTL